MHDTAVYETLQKFSTEQVSEQDSSTQIDFGALPLHETAQAIETALKRLLGDEAIILDPTLFLTDSPAANTLEAAQAGAIKCAKLIAGYGYLETEEFGKPLVDKHTPLQKPLILIFPAPFVDTDGNTINTTDSHWVSCVILPKNYQPPFGEALHNAEEQLFTLDSIYQRPFPPPLKKILLSGLLDQTPGQTLLIPAAFPEGIVPTLPSPSLQQKSYSESRFWVVYNTLMLVMTGRVEFLARFVGKRRHIPENFRELFPELVVTSPKERLLNTFSEKMQHLSRTAPETAAAIEDKLCALFKLNLLETNCQKNHSLTRDSLSTLAALDERHAAVKFVIAQQASDIQTLLKNLSTSDLSQFINLIEKPEEFQRVLDQACEKKIHTLEAWEAQLKKEYQEKSRRWLPWLWHKTQRGIVFTYKHSVLALSINLSNWIGKPLVQKWKPAAEAKKQQLQTRMKEKIFHLTSSAYIADKSYEVTGLFLSPQMPLIVIGGGIGLFWLRALSWYSIGRLIGMGALHTGIQHYFMHRSVTDVAASTSRETQLIPAPNTMRERAIHTFKFFTCQREVRGKKRSQLSPQLLVAGSGLALAGIEATIWKDASYFLLALSGIAGSSALSHFVVWMVPEWQNTQAPAMTEDQAYTLLITAAVGYQIGYGVMSLSVDVYRHVTLCEETTAKVTALMEEAGAKNAQMISQRHTWSPLFWYTGKTNTTLKWAQVEKLNEIQESASFHERNCELTLATQTRSVLLNCEATQEYSPLQLA